MSKIKEVNIENFRNIKSLKFNVEDTVTLISGRNGIGKSNTLNALAWFFTNSLLTDKWGTGENDLDSIVPTNQVKGEHVLVEVTFDSGVKFSKYYKTGYDRITGKPNKHTTDVYINDIQSKNTTAWYEELYKEINYQPMLKSVKEVNLFADPLYALQKLDQKQLREMLVELGCSVSNDDVYASSIEFETLKQYESQCRGNFVDLRKSLKTEIKKIETAIKEKETLLKAKQTAEDVPQIEIDAIKKNIDELKEKKTLLKNTSTRTKELEIEANNLKHQLEIDKEQLLADKKGEIADLNAQLIIEQERISNLKKNATQGIILKVETINKELITLRNTKNTYSRMLEGFRNQLATIQTSGKNASEKIKRLESEYLKEKNTQFEVESIECPNCHEVIVLNQDARVKFEEKQKANLEYIQKQIHQAQTDIANAKTSQADVIKNANDLKSKIEESTQLIETKETELNALNLELKTASDISVDYSKLDGIKANLQSKKEELQNLENINIYLEPEYVAILGTLEDSKLSDQVANSNALMELDSKIRTLEEDYENLLIKRHDYLDKLEIMKAIEELEMTRNDKMFLLEKVKDFIHKSISILNDKAKAMFGLEFVMLEETLTTEDIKEVCYIEVNGVRTSSVNTAEKCMIGINFIEKVKEVLESNFNIERNEIPMLADRLEGLDDLNLAKLSEMKGNQIIGTLVTPGIEKIKIGGAN